MVCGEHFWVSPRKKRTRILERPLGEEKEMEKELGQHAGRVTHQELRRTLGPWQLWGIAVGLVISGEYFGWSYGWATAGTLGFVVT